MLNTEYLKTNYTAYCIKKIISWCLTKFSIEIEIHMQNECKLFTVKILCNTLWVVNKLAPFILHSTLIIIWMYTCMDCIIVVVYKCGLYLYNISKFFKWLYSSVFDFIILNFVHYMYELCNLDISVFKFKDPIFLGTFKKIWINLRKICLFDLNIQHD